MPLARKMKRFTVSALALWMIIYPFGTVSASALNQAEGPTRSSAMHFPLHLSRDAHALQRVFSVGVLDLTVVQQPASNQAYVSTEEDQATQFSLASRYGNIGLLAHNYLAGKFFPHLTVGTKVRLAYTDGKIESFVVSQVLRYQALRPQSPLSSFRDLATDQTLSAAQVFSRVYSGKHHLTFQTCIAHDGNLSWGRLFVIAVPVEEFDGNLPPM